MEPLLSISGELVLLAAILKAAQKPISSQPLTQAVWKKEEEKTCY
jgi:DNA-binding winged helix-turn-helix (wHTH) protein